MLAAKTNGDGKMWSETLCFEDKATGFLDRLDVWSGRRIISMILRAQGDK